MAHRNIGQARRRAWLEVVHGNVTDPTVGLPFSIFSYAICLNNTLGWADDDKRTIVAIRGLAQRTAMVSVFGPQFSDELAEEYFVTQPLNLKEIDGDRFVMESGQTMQRYRREDVEAWGGEVVEMPLGYLAVLGGLAPFGV